MKTDEHVIDTLGVTLRLAKTALTYYGATHQEDKCLEEMGELASAIVKYRHSRTESPEVLNECADVLLTVLQVALSHGTASEFMDAVNAKSQKLVSLMISPPADG